MAALIIMNSFHILCKIGTLIRKDYYFSIINHWKTYTNFKSDVKKYKLKLNIQAFSYKSFRNNILYQANYYVWGMVVYITTLFEEKRWRIDEEQKKNSKYSNYFD
uniref:Uncharacterized protein n=1 Tax=Romanomermis culicivorax TaxID=13658 RepID=A0A915IS64_ROMCU